MKPLDINLLNSTHQKLYDFGWQEVIDRRERVMQEISPSIEQAVADCVNNGKKLFGNVDFYVVGSQLLDIYEQKTKIKWHPNLSCPTPTLEQHVLKYLSQSGNLQHMWTLPRFETYDFYTNCHPSQVPPSEMELYNFCWKFKTQELDEICRQLNNETAGEPVKVAKFDTPLEASNFTLTEDNKTETINEREK